MWSPRGNMLSTTVGRGHSSLKGWPVVVWGGLGGDHVNELGEDCDELGKGLCQRVPFPRLQTFARLYSHHIAASAGVMGTMGPPRGGEQQQVQHKRSPTDSARPIMASSRRCSEIPFERLGCPD